MKRGENRGRKWLVAVGILIATIALVYVTVDYAIANIGLRVMETKAIRRTTATVIKTTAEGIYFRIDNFDSVKEPDRTRLIQAERERNEKGMLRNMKWDRFVYRGRYEEPKEGEKLIIEYQWRGGEDILVIKATLPRWADS